MVVLDKEPAYRLAASLTYIKAPARIIPFTRAGLAVADARGLFTQASHSSREGRQARCACMQVTTVSSPAAAAGQIGYRQILVFGATGSPRVSVAVMVWSRG